MCGALVAVLSTMFGLDESVQFGHLCMVGAFQLLDCMPPYRHTSNECRVDGAVAVTDESHVSHIVGRFSLLEPVQNDICFHSISDEEASQFLQHLWFSWGIPRVHALQCLLRTPMYSVFVPRMMATPDLALQLCL